MPPSKSLHSQSILSGYSGHFHGFTLFSMGEMETFLRLSGVNISLIEEHRKLTRNFIIIEGNTLLLFWSKVSHFSKQFYHKKKV
jgi:hypothetical protein